MGCSRLSFGFLQRWPCWPGPYSRSLKGLLGRPQRLTPRRRSILYLDSARFVIRLLAPCSTVVVHVPSVRPGSARRRGGVIVLWTAGRPQLGSRGTIGTNRPLSSTQ